MVRSNAGRNEDLLRSVRAQRRRRQRRRWLGAGVALGLLAYVVVFGDTGWLAVRDQERQVDTLRAEIARLEAERAGFEASLAELRTAGGFELERTARELYRMQKPGEEVHHLIGGDDLGPLP